MSQVNKTGIIRLFFPFLFLLNSSLRLCGQQFPKSKPALDTSTLDKWPVLSSPAISPYGGYVSYGIKQVSTGKDVFIISASSGGWQKEYSQITGSCVFSADERTALLQQRDGLHIVALGENKPDQIISIRSFQYAPASAAEWVSYQEKAGELVLVNLLNSKVTKLGKVYSYRLDNQGKMLWISRLSESDTTATTELEGRDLETGINNKMWSGSPKDKLLGFNLSDNGQQLSIITKEKRENKDLLSIWYYRKGMERAVLKLRDGDPRIDNGLQIGGRVEFSQTGKWMFFLLTQPVPINSSKAGPDAVQVDLWSYRDRLLDPEQLDKELQLPKQFYAVMSTEGNIFWRLERPKQSLAMSIKTLSSDRMLIVDQDSKGISDPWSLFTYPRSLYLFSLVDGTRKPLSQKSMADYSFSPDGRWLVFYDYKKENYFSYDLQSGQLHNITANLPTKVNSDHPCGVYYSTPPEYSAGWVRENENVLIYDNFDLWQIDPAGKKPAINVTGGYGNLHHVKLRLIEKQDRMGQKLVYSLGDTLLFTGFNIDNKANGFLRTELGAKRNAEALYIGPYTFYRTSSQKPHYYSFDNGMSPIKASNTNCWIVQRESDREAPNYFLTTDLKSFRPLTHLAPQSQYNWLTTELITYRQLDGTLSQGILYKPENFDSTKKYPVIFNFYEQLSHRLYEFPRPECMTENINIPWFVSHGYLVFTPDIHYDFATRSGKTAGQYAYNSVIAAARHLAKLSYIDSRHMGLQGHSFGALETNYLITHTHLFAAASEMAGTSDPVSGYLTLLPTPNNREENRENQSISEYGQLRIGATLWQRPDLYLKESAVLRADQVTTPLLIVHNKQDDAVPWHQGVELYMALRRLNRRVWMLQYDNGKHLVSGKDAIDYTIRVTQFFDYYLKGILPPKWLTEGIPAPLKGIRQGYELDNSGKTP